MRVLSEEPHVTDLVYILAAYGLCFALMNERVPLVGWLSSKVNLLARMLECPYCTGFHCGWFVWGLRGLVEGFPTEPLVAGVSAFVWTMGVAASCYVLDTVARCCEGSTPGEGG